MDQQELPTSAAQGMEADHKWSKNDKKFQKNDENNHKEFENDQKRSNWS